MRVEANAKMPTATAEPLDSERRLARAVIALAAEDALGEKSVDDPRMIAQAQQFLLGAERGSTLKLWCELAGIRTSVIINRAREMRRKGWKR